MKPLDNSFGPKVLPMSLETTYVSGLNKIGLVDLERFELSTSSMPWKRAPNCATGPLSGGLRPENITSLVLERVPSELLQKYFSFSCYVLLTHHPKQGTIERLKEFGLV